MSNFTQNIAFAKQACTLAMLICSKKLSRPFYKLALCIKIGKYNLFVLIKQDDFMALSNCISSWSQDIIKKIVQIYIYETDVFIMDELQTFTFYIIR